MATTKDEVVVCLESPGGMVHSYGLAASQMMRVRDRNIPLTAVVDKGRQRRLLNGGCGK